jgi:tetratricopeptide (TPR) repeat protein
LTEINVRPGTVLACHRIHAPKPFDFEKEMDLSSLSEEQAIMQLMQAYSFLGMPLAVSLDNDQAVIIAQVGKPHLAREAAKAFQRANESAQRGNYEQAIQLYKQVLDISPESVDTRRNLAMACLESKQLAKAKQHLLEALRLEPKDAWSNLLAGNILAKYEDKLDAAMKWYRRAYETDPNDAILLTNIGAMLKEQGHTDEAADYFARAIAANPKYPNSYYALALTKLEANDPEAALTQIDALFSTAEPMDSRSNPLMVESRKLYARINQKAAKKIRRTYACRSSTPVRTWRDNWLSHRCS